MHDHDIDADAAGAGAARPHDEHEALSGQDLGRGVEAGRPDALGPGGLLHLQQAAGNAGVASLVAQRKAATEGDERDGAGSPVHDVVGSRGTPLDPDTRADMEAAVGHDFGDVQVHTDARAAESARSVQAHAYTVGNHVVFGEGRYRPESPEGRHTLAHELTHVVQQRQGPVDGSPADGGITVSHPSDRFEQEAEAVARRVTSSTAAAPAEPTGAGPTPTSVDVQRQEAQAEPPVQRQEAGEEQEDEEGPPPEAEAASAGPEAEAPAGPEAEAPAEDTGTAEGGAGPAAEGPTEAPADTMPAEGPAPEGRDEAVEEDEEASVSKLDQGIGVQRQADEGDEDESVTAG